MYTLGIDPTLVVATTDVPGFDVNQVGFNTTSDGAKGYQFVQANGAIAVGDVVQIDEVGDATPVTTTTSAPATGQGLPAGVAVVALADNEWGWVQRFGIVDSINVGSSAAVHTELNSTATAGRIDDDASTGAEVLDGITTTAAESSNTAAGILNWPLVGRTL
jgi:hypothetical protein